MGRTIVAVILLVTTIRAQVVGDLSGDPTATRDGDIRQKKIYGSFGFQYNHLRRGTEEYGEVLLLGPHTFALTDPRSKDPRIVPTKLEVQDTPGFQISPIIYPAGQDRRFLFSPKSFKVLNQTHAAPVRFRFKVRAVPDLPSGDYLLRAKLKYQVISNAGISEPQQFDVEMPIKVVDHTAKVKTEDRSIAGIRGITPAEWVEIVLLAPLMIPVGILMAALGWDGC